MAEDTNAIVDDIARGRRCASEDHDHQLARRGRTDAETETLISQLRAKLAILETQSGNVATALGLTKDMDFFQPASLATPAATLAMIEAIEQLKREAGTPRPVAEPKAEKPAAGPKSAATLLGEQLGEQLVEHGKKALLTGLEGLRTWGEKLQEEAEAKRKPGSRS